MVRISRPVDWYFGQKFLSDIITWRQKYGFFNERFLLDETETKSLSFNTTIRVILGRRVPNLLNWYSFKQHFYKNWCIENDITLKTFKSTT